MSFHQVPLPSSLSSSGAVTDEREEVRIQGLRRPFIVTKCKFLDLFLLLELVFLSSTMNYTSHCQPCATSILKP